MATVGVKLLDSIQNFCLINWHWFAINDFIGTNHTHVKANSKWQNTSRTFYTVWTGKVLCQCWYPLHPTASRTCVVMRTYNTFGDRAFAAAGPRLWNSLPLPMLYSCTHIATVDIKGLMTPSKWLVWCYQSQQSWSRLASFSISDSRLTITHPP